MTVEWNKDGSYTVTVSNGQQVVVTDPDSRVQLHGGVGQPHVRLALERRAVQALHIAEEKASLCEADFLH